LRAATRRFFTRCTGASLLRRRLLRPAAHHPPALVQAHAAVFVLAGGEQLSVGRHPHQPTQHLDVPVGPGQQVSLARRIRRLHQHLQDVQRPVGQPLTEHESLVLREALHPFQHPLGHVVPLDQQNRRLIATWSHALRHFSKSILAALGCKG